MIAKNIVPGANPVKTASVLAVRRRLPAALREWEGVRGLLSNHPQSFKFCGGLLKSPSCFRF